MFSRCRKNTDVTRSNNDNKDGGSISDTGSVSRREEDFKKRKRLMKSTGHNIITTGVPERNRKYFSDLYTTLIDIQWRWNILIFLGGFVFTWILFACFYYFQMHLHGDFDDDKPVGAARCLDNVHSFTAAYLFSIETMTTIGYGFRGQTEECPGVYLAVLIQSILGAGLQFALASLVVSKTRRAKRRSETILFSNHICVCEQDSCLQLAVRVADMRKSEICGAHAKGFLVKKLRSGDGTFIPIRSFTLAFKSQSGRDEIFFPWPTQLLHTVDEESPLWSLSRDDFLSGKYELIVVLDGVCGSTSSPFQARKSYHTHEMKWGYRFATLNMTYKDSTYVMDLANFHHTVPASTPLCSAQDINSLRVMYSANHPEYRFSSSPTTHNKQRIYTKRRTSTTSDKRKNSDASSVRKSTSNSQEEQGQQNQIPLQELSVRNLMSSCSSSSRMTTLDPPAIPHRSHSMEERRRGGGGDAPKEPDLEKTTARRRCSLGDLIRTTRGHQQHQADKGDNSIINSTLYGDAKNMYRYRKSVTDTYLGFDIQEDGEDDEGSSNYLAMLSVVSQASSEKRTDVRDVFNKRRRSSVSKLFFGPDTGSSSSGGGGSSSDGEHELKGDEKETKRRPSNNLDTNNASTIQTHSLC